MYVNVRLNFDSWAKTCCDLLRQHDVNIFNWFFKFETTDGKAKVAKEIIESIDEKNNSITFKVIEGDLLEEYKNIKITIQATAKGEGSVVHWTMEYEKLHENIPEPNTLLQFALDLSKDLDSHLITQA